MTLAPALYKKFFATMHRATTALGLLGDCSKDYYRLVLHDCAGVSSIKQLPDMAAYDACLRRMMLDAGDFSRPPDYAGEKLKRYAYVIKVMTSQIMQLARIDELSARSYFDGVVKQSRRGGGIVSGRESWYLDVNEPNLLLFIKILDTHLRRLKRRHFPLFPLSFNDKVRFVYVPHGDLFLIEDVDKYYYARQPFSLL